MKSIISIINVGLILVLLSGCSQPERSLDGEIRLGLLPDRDRQTIIKLYEPLQKYLEQELDIKVSLVLADSYGDLLTKFSSNEIDLANFGALTFVQAQHLVEVRPLVMRDIDTRFTSYFIVHKDSEYQSLLEVADKHLMFGAELSTSAHMMPRFFLTQKDINPEQFFSEVSYSGKHDRTVELIANQSADVGAVNAIIYDQLKADNDPRAEQTRIIWETPPYTDYVWTMHKGYNPKVYQKISQAFLSLNYEEQQHQVLMNNLGTRGFLPANAREFNDIRSMAQAMGMLTVENE